MRMNSRSFDGDYIGSILPSDTIKKEIQERELNTVNENWKSECSLLSKEIKLESQDWTGTVGKNDLYIKEEIVSPNIEYLSPECKLESTDTLICGETVSKNIQHSPDSDAIGSLYPEQEKNENDIHLYESEEQSVCDSSASPELETLKSKHENMQAGYSCCECRKSFTRRHSLNRHMNIHTHLKSYPCNQCGESFTHKQSLSRHSNIHNISKHCICDYCGKSLPDESRKRKHMNIHIGLKPFSCSQCGKSFTQKKSLSSHMNIHAGVKPYSCHFCGKSFTQKPHLISHASIHTGVKPYSCNNCEKSFSEKSKLRRHMNIHMQEKKF